MEFNHVGIKCIDVDASYKFYCEVLGLKKIFEVEILGKRCVFVGLGALQIELEEIKTTGELSAAPPESGLNHISFSVTGIEDEAEKLKERGADFMIPPFQIRPTRKTAFIKAPDGVMIQLVEDFPEEKS